MPELPCHKIPARSGPDAGICPGRLTDGCQSSLMTPLATRSDQLSRFGKLAMKRAIVFAVGELQNLIAC